MFPIQGSYNVLVESNKLFSYQSRQYLLSRQSKVKRELKQSTTWLNDWLISLQIYHSSSSHFIWSSAVSHTSIDPGLSSVDDIRLVDAVEVDTSSPSSSNLTQPFPLTLWTVSVSPISQWWLVLWLLAVDCGVFPIQCWLAVRATTLTTWRHQVTPGTPQYLPPDQISLLLPACPLATGTDTVQ